MHSILCMTKPTVTKKDMEKAISISLVDISSEKKGNRKYLLVQASLNKNKSWDLKQHWYSIGKNKTIDNVKSDNIRDFFNIFMTDWNEGGVAYEVVVSNKNKIFKIIRGSGNGARYLRDIMN